MGRRYTVDGAVRTAYLALLAAETGRPRRATVIELDADRLADVEDSVGQTLEGPSLLLFADGGFLFAEVLRLHVAARAEGLPKNLLPLEHEDNTWTCLDLSADEPTIVLYLDEDKSTATMPLAKWFDRRREEATEGVLAPAKQLGGETLEAVLPTAKVVRAASYRVKHPKFGEGLVLSEDGVGDALKLEVDFGGEAGKKKLLARFVTRVE